MLFAAFAGYYACLWPGARAVRRICSLVIAPAIAGICLNFGRFVYLGRSPISLLDRSLFSGYFQSWQAKYWIASPGFHVAFAGLLLIAIFTVQLIRGGSSLPLAFPEASVMESSDATLWRRIRFLIWLFVGPVFLVATIPAVVLGLFLEFRMGAGSLASLQSPSFQMWSTILEAIIYLAITYWILTREGRVILRGVARFSAPIYLFLGAGFSIGIAVLISSTQYLIDRAQWAPIQFGNEMPPQPATYFNLPSVWLLSMFFGAFFEELVFRGLLQTIFFRRYGLYRGIFLTNIVWAAYHFNSDASFTSLNEARFLSRVTFRLAICLTLGFVLSWLTLRSGSILAASVTHTLYNVLVSGFGRSFTGRSWVWVGMWGVLAYALFRYWPLRPPRRAEQEFPAGEPGIAT
jgi:membrane protease YdiL (CAAX protease family)